MYTVLIWDLLHVCFIETMGSQIIKLILILTLVNFANTIIISMLMCNQCFNCPVNSASHGDNNRWITNITNKHFSFKNKPLLVMHHLMVVKWPFNAVIVLTGNNNPPMVMILATYMGFKVYHKEMKPWLFGKVSCTFILLNGKLFLSIR